MYGDPVEVIYKSKNGMVISIVGWIKYDTKYNHSDGKMHDVIVMKQQWKNSEPVTEVLLDPKRIIEIEVKYDVRDYLGKYMSPEYKREND